MACLGGAETKQSATNTSTGDNGVVVSGTGSSNQGSGASSSGASSATTTGGAAATSSGTASTGGSVAASGSATVATPGSSQATSGGTVNNGVQATVAEGGELTVTTADPLIAQQFAEAFSAATASSANLAAAVIASTNEQAKAVTKTFTDATAAEGGKLSQGTIVVVALSVAGLLAIAMTRPKKKP